MIKRAPLDLRPRVARAFIGAMVDYFVEANPIKRDAIAAHQLDVLKRYQGPREKKLRLSDVKEMFAQMRDVTYRNFASLKLPLRLQQFPDHVGKRWQSRDILSVESAGRAHETKTPVARLSAMKTKQQKPHKSNPPIIPESRLARQMSDVISLREKVAQAELVAHRYGLRNPDRADPHDGRRPTRL